MSVSAVSKSPCLMTSQPSLLSKSPILAIMSHWTPLARKTLPGWGWLGTFWSGERWLSKSLIGGAPLDFFKKSSVEGLNAPNIIKLFEVTALGNIILLYGGCEERGLVWGGSLSHVSAAGISGTVWLPDLKPDVELNIKLVDFGLSSEFTGHKLTMFCGTLSMPPQSSSGTKPVMAQGWCMKACSSSVQDSDGDPAIYRENFGKLKQQILNRHYHVSYLCLSKVKNFLKNWWLSTPTEEQTWKI